MRMRTRHVATAGADVVAISPLFMIGLFGTAVLCILQAVHALSNWQEPSAVYQSRARCRGARRLDVVHSSAVPVNEVSRLFRAGINKKGLPIL